MIWLILLGIALFLLTRKRYVFSIPPFFIPKLETGVKDKKSLLEYLTKLDVSYVNGEWRIGVKPINGFKVPIAIYLPKYFPLALPQIALQLKSKLVIDEVKFGDKVYGYWVYTKEPMVVYL